MKNYVIRNAASAVPLTGDKAGAWAGANELTVGEFPWFKGGSRQGTTARALYDERALYLQFVCEDKHIWSQARPLNGPVCIDSCVEFFASPLPGQGPEYFNFEANCCGQFHVGFGPGRGDRKLIDPGIARGIRVATSVPGPLKDESPTDAGWWLAAALPFETLAKFTGLEIAPASRSIWRANFYRCGGKTNQQFACWNVVGTPGPDFHQPEFFGEVRFE